MTRARLTKLPDDQASYIKVPESVPLSRLSDNFLDGTSSVYLEELQRAWEADPASVDASWDTFFRNFTGQAATNNVRCCGAGGHPVRGG